MMLFAVKGMDGVVSLLRSAPKQVRFALAKSLNATALDVQKRVVDELLPEKFTLRTKWFQPRTKFGFNIKFASRENTVAIVGSQADWLQLQEDGGTKQVQGHRLAIPTPFWKKREEIMARDKKPAVILRYFNRLKAREAAQRQRDRAERVAGVYVDSDGRTRRYTTRRARANSLAANNRKRQAAAVGASRFHPFIARMPGGSEGIFVRSSSSRLPIHKLFAFKSSAQVQARLDFEPTAARTARDVFDRHFARELLQAFAKAK